MQFEAKNKNKDFSTLMTKVFVQVPFSSPLRDPQQEVVLMVDSETRQIIDYGQYAKNTTTSYTVSKKHVPLKRQARQFELLTDVVDTEIAICSRSLL
jgi:hypothetical protein